MARGSGPFPRYDVCRVFGGLGDQIVEVPTVRGVQGGAFDPDGCDFEIRALMLGGFTEPAIKLGPGSAVQVSRAALDEPFAGFLVDLAVEFRSHRAFHGDGPIELARGVDGSASTPS